MIEEFEKHYKELEQKVKNDLSLFTEWKQEAQLYCVLKLYLEYGVLRSNEIIIVKLLIMMITIKLIILILKAKTFLLIFIKTIRKDRKWNAKREDRVNFFFACRAFAASPRIMGVIVLGDVCFTCNSNSVLRMQIPVYETPGCPVG
jgi:hypothetical protein